MNENELLNHLYLRIQMSDFSLLDIRMMRGEIPMNYALIKPSTLFHPYITLIKQAPENHPDSSYLRELVVLNERLMEAHLGREQHDLERGVRLNDLDYFQCEVLGPPSGNFDRLRTALTNAGYTVTDPCIENDVRSCEVHW
jgi:hypothetical protein